MAALVQSYPQQSSTVTMLQTRPASSSGILQGSQGQGHYKPNIAHMHRNSYTGIGSGQTTYRGQTSSAPVAPYAFTSTPSLTLNGGRTPGAPFLRSDQRTCSAPVTPTLETHDSNRSRYPAAESVSTISSSSSDLSAGARSSGTRDDSSVSSVPSTPWTTSQVQRPKSTIVTPSTQLQNTTTPETTKPLPDRYRRPGNRKTDATPSPTKSGPSSPSIPGSTITDGFNSSFQLPPFYSQTLHGSADDMMTSRQQAAREEGGRYRRRSIHTIDMGSYLAAESDTHSRAVIREDHQHGVGTARPTHQDPLRSSPVGAIRPSSSPGRSAGSEALANPRANPSVQATVSVSRIVLAVYAW